MTQHECNTNILRCGRFLPKIHPRLEKSTVGREKKRQQELGRVQFVKAKSLRWWFVITFPASGLRMVYQRHVQKYWLADFPGLPSYNRFIEVMADVLMPMLHLCEPLRQRQWHCICRFDAFVCLQKHPHPTPQNLQRGGGAW